MENRKDAGSLTIQTLDILNFSAVKLTLTLLITDVIDMPTESECRRQFPIGEN